MKETHPRIDAHHHFWDPTRATYPWMAGDALDPMRRPFTPADLAPELAAQGISGTVLVQTISSDDETREFLELAERTDFVWGVVGWVDLTSDRVGDHIDALIGGIVGGRLVGIRHKVHDEDDPEWLCRADVRRGLTAKEVFFAVRDEFKRQGLPFSMPHIGHGMGIGLHEYPMLEPGNDTPLEVGMVLNVEPMALIASRREGYHTEDLAAVTESGRRLLTPPQERLLIIPG